MPTMLAARLYEIGKPMQLEQVWNVPDFIDTGLGCQFGEFPES